MLYISKDIFVDIARELRHLPKTENSSILKLPIEHAPVFHVLLRSDQLINVEGHIQDQSVSVQGHDLHVPVYLLPTFWQK